MKWNLCVDLENFLIATSDPWISSRSLGIGLWIGLAILTVTLLVLMRTRWGQARPISKCVALSIFAHVLLLGYAYGTRLILTVPVEAPVSEVAVEIVDDLIEPDENEDADESESRAPWNQYVGTGAAESDVDPAMPSPEPMEVQQPNIGRLANQSIDPAELDPQDYPQVHSAAMPLLPNAPSVESIPFESIHSPMRPAQIMRTQPTRVDQSSTTENVAIRVPQHSPQPMNSGRSDAPLNERMSGPGDLQYDTSLHQLTESLIDPTLSFALPGPDRLRVTQSTSDGPVSRSVNEIMSGQPESPASIWSQFSSSQHIARRDISDRELIEQLTRVPQSRLGDGRPMPEPFRLRRSDQRLNVALAQGGTLETEEAVDDALEWLAANQRVDGAWDASQHQAGVESEVLGHDRGGAGSMADTGITGLAILAFLSAGETHLEGSYRDTVADAINFLLREQDSTGDLSGDALLYARMYCHGMALFALSEAYAMTGDHRLRMAIESGIQYTVDSQHPTSGGWRYQPGDLGDMSQFGWQVMAIKSASMIDITVPESTHGGMIFFLESCCSGAASGLASYRPKERPSPTMSAEALVCRLMLQPSVEDDLIREAHRMIADGLINESPDAELNLYLLYYGTMAMFLAQDESWPVWNQKMQSLLLESQVRDGVNAGSWNPDTVWGGYGGRVYSTAMAALCLEVYYRYLPLYNATDFSIDTARKP